MKTSATRKVYIAIFLEYLCFFGTTSFKLLSKSFFLENRVNSKSALFRILHLVNMLVTPILVDVQSILAHQCFQNSIQCSIFADTELRCCTFEFWYVVFKKNVRNNSQKKKLVLKILPTISNILENSLKQ